MSLTDKRDTHRDGFRHGAIEKGSGKAVRERTLAFLEKLAGDRCRLAA